MRKPNAEPVGTMDTSDTYPVCDTCEYVEWERRTADGGPCPECEERELVDDDAPVRFEMVESVDANGLRTIVAMANHYGRR